MPMQNQRNNLFNTLVAGCCLTLTPTSGAGAQTALVTPYIDRCTAIAGEYEQQITAFTPVTAHEAFVFGYLEGKESDIRNLLGDQNGLGPINIGGERLSLNLWLKWIVGRCKTHQDETLMATLAAVYYEKIAFPLLMRRK
ncbi:MAG: hypothetical protein EXQ88_04795 [Alphaproteobacteria bacterium]|nr:hypothetical protein [Alphaproteobacteria bacterium]